MARFQLQDKNGKTVTEKDLRDGYSYIVFWYDPKMKNYTNFIDYIFEKKFIQAKVKAILLVD
jgi:hypothetical protein